MIKLDEKKIVQDLAKEFKFDICKITNTDLPTNTDVRLKEFIDLGFHGEMNWLADSYERRKSPLNLWKEAKSAIILGLNYGPKNNPLEKINKKNLGNISVYAQGKDYHKIIKGRLKLFSSKLISKLAKVKETKIKVFVDTAPLMEKPLAEKSGLGWQGKHTNLVSRDFGSWLFLGVILVNRSFEFDTQEKNYCGSCTKCLDICPTDAFYGENKLDASKCISYLTIEHKNVIPKEFRSAIGNRIFGCDDCQIFCPWNKFTHYTDEKDFLPRHKLDDIDLCELFLWTEEDFLKKTEGSPIRRVGYECWLRNIAIALGNANFSEVIIKNLNTRKDFPSAIVKEHVNWAIKEQERKSYE